MLPTTTPSSFFMGSPPGKVISPPFDASIPLPLCAKGTRSCPPEDCGGPWGYSHLLEVLSDSAHEEHDELSEWVGDHFSPEEFDLALVNELLREHSS